MKPENHHIRKKCWDNGIKVVQQPTIRGYTKGGFPVRLNLEINKTIVKFGTMEFKQNSQELNDKIDEIYQHYHDRIP